MKPFAIDLKNPATKKLWAIGGCVLALAAVQLLSIGAAHGSSLGGAPLRLVVVLGCFAGAALWIVRRARPRTAAKGLEPALKVVSKTALGPKNALALVEADGIRVLVAYGDGFARVLPLDAVGAHKENAS